jgi:hypothetical protein
MKRIHVVSFVFLLMFAAAPCSAQKASTFHMGIEPSTLYIGIEPSTIHIGIELSTIHFGTEPSIMQIGTEPSTIHFGTEPSTIYIGTEPSTLPYICWWCNGQSLVSKPYAYRGRDAEFCSPTSILWGSYLTNATKSFGSSTSFQFSLSASAATFELLTRAVWQGKGLMLRGSPLLQRFLVAAR